MACIATDVTTLEALLTSILLTTLYVASLYLPFNAGDRDHPRVVVSRLYTIGALAAFSEWYVRQRVPAVHHIQSTPPLKASCAAALLTLLLYSGHLAARPSIISPHLRAHPAFRLIALRNYLLAPFLEELVFRRHSLLLWSCQSQRLRIMVPAALFSSAHAHHALNTPMSLVLLQLAYTMLFGIYAATIFVGTNSLLATVTAHVICNVLGLPDFHAIATHTRKRVIIALYIASVILFIVLFAPIIRGIAPVEPSAAH